MSDTGYVLKCEDAPPEATEMLTSIFHILAGHHPETAITVLLNALIPTIGIYAGSEANAQKIVNRFCRELKAVSTDRETWAKLTSNLSVRSISSNQVH
jgi:hypothetical protein